MRALPSSLLRFTGAMVIASVITFTVFLAMQSLISSRGSALEENDFGRLVSFVDVSQDDELQTRKRKPKKPPVPPQEPPKPDLPKLDLDSAANNNSFDISGFDINTELDINAGLTGGTGDGDYLPIVKVAPQYPRRAAQRGIEGYVVLEFTVTQLGTVIDPQVIESKPPGVFDRAAIEAARKFKYKPKVINGEAQQVTGVRNIIRFELAK